MRWAISEGVLAEEGYRLALLPHGIVGQLEWRQIGPLWERNVGLGRSWNADSAKIRHLPPDKRQVFGFRKSKEIDLRLW